jgi:uncharacterized membrane protein YgdD (TMEM256/DUF423 family)
MTTLTKFSEGMDRNRMAAGTGLLALAVIAGAFGAHALQGLLDARYQQTYQTAVNYHFYHAFALLICGIIPAAAQAQWLKLAYRFFVAGLILFCGSLYALCLITAAGNTSFKWLGMITPFGGLCFIAGWILLTLALIKERS